MKKINLPKPSKYLVWISVALIVKLTFLLIKVVRIDFGKALYNTYGLQAGDTKSYIEPIENLIINGEYYDDYRMPGYGWVYFIFRLFFNQSFSLNLLLFAQVILSALSVYVLSLIALKIFRKPAYFYATFIIYLISTYTSAYDAFLLTESFCTSALIFSIYFLVMGGRKNYFLSGLFMTWVIFLRPVFAPILVIFLVYLLFDLYLKRELRLNYKLATSFFLLYFPFVLIDGSWIVRNYIKYEKVIPLSKSIYYPGIEESYLGALFRFMNAFGGSIVWWEPGSEIIFFKELPDVVKSQNIKQTRPIPSSVFTSKFNLDSLYAIKKQIAVIESDSTVSELEKKKIEEDVILKLNNYTKSIKEEKPFLFYFSSRLNVFRSFFFHSGTQNLFQKSYQDLNKFQRFIKVFYFLLYICTTLFGLITLILLFFSSLRNAQFLLISSCGLYSSLIYPLVLKMDEHRYLATSYPIFTLAFAFALVAIYHKIFKTR